MLLSFTLHFLNNYFVFGVYIFLFGVTYHHFFPFVDNTLNLFFSTARGSVLKPEPVTIHKYISGMKIHSYVHCLLLPHFIFEICSTLVTPS